MASRGGRHRETREAPATSDLQRGFERDFGNDKNHQCRKHGYANQGGVADIRYPNSVRNSLA